MHRLIGELESAPHLKDLLNRNAGGLSAKPIRDGSLTVNCPPVILPKPVRLTERRLLRQRTLIIARGGLIRLEVQRPCRLPDISRVSHRNPRTGVEDLIVATSCNFKRFARHEFRAGNCVCTDSPSTLAESCPTDGFSRGTTDRARAPTALLELPAKPGHSQMILRTEIAIAFSVRLPISARKRLGSMSYRRRREVLGCRLSCHK